ncbi:hypothetical protein Tco_0755527, partial [Tanacetum coccineum]
TSATGKETAGSFVKPVQMAAENMGSKITPTQGVLASHLRCSHLLMLCQKIRYVKGERASEARDLDDETKQEGDQQALDMKLFLTRKPSDYAGSSVVVN